MSGVAADRSDRPARGRLASVETPPSGVLPDCAWCGAATAPAGRRVIACRTCGVAITYPVPDVAELDAAYGGHYRPAEGRFSAGADRLLARTRGALARKVDAAAPPGPVLDVGAGDGSLLDALALRGREAVGLERERAWDARPNVVAAELIAFEERRGEWAAIILWHALEHLRDAPAALDHAAGLLAPGGVLLIAVPNRDSWQARVLGDRWLALDLPRHLTHLTARGLLARLRRDGLTVDEVSFWRGGQVLFGWLHGLVAQLPQHPDLYDAIRRPAARAVSISPRRRALTLVCAAMLVPLAGVLSVAEVLAGHGGTVFVQARLPPDSETAYVQPADRELS